jgi:hypothetical protein
MLSFDTVGEILRHASWSTIVWLMFVVRLVEPRLVLSAVEG